MKKSSEQIVNIPSIDYLRKNLYEIKDWYETVCFGSIVEGTFRPESDIDIAVITEIMIKTVILKYYLIYTKNTALNLILRFSNYFQFMFKFQLSKIIG